MDRLRRAVLAVALAAACGGPCLPARAALLSDLSLVYLEDFAGETGSPMTPEYDPLGIGGATAFKQLGNGTPVIGFNFGVVLFSVSATTGDQPVEQAGVHAIPAFPDDGETVGVGAALRSWNTTIVGDAQLFGGVYFANSSAGLAATVQETVQNGANELALVLTELDVAGGTPRPSRSVALDSTARAAVEGGQAFTVELRYDRGAQQALARLTAPGVQVDTEPLSAPLLAGATISFAGAAARAVNVLSGQDLGRDDSIVVAVEELAILAPEPGGLLCGFAALAALASARGVQGLRTSTRSPASSTRASQPGYTAIVV